MGLEEDYKKIHEEGLPKLINLFNLNKGELIACLKELLKDHEGAMSVLNNNPRVTKEIVDDEINSIKLNFYDNIDITTFGINYRPENGPGTKLVAFDRFFNAEEILKFKF